MLYPRKTELGELVTDEQMVGAAEHLICENRLLHLGGPITVELSLYSMLFALDSLSHEPIKLVITSPGGDLDAAFLCYDAIRLITAPVWTLGRFCASAAVLLLAAGQKRYLSPHAKVVLHLPSNYFQRDTVIPVQEIETLSREAKKYKDKMIDILIECGARRSKEEILHDVDRDFWLEPQEAIEYGLADKIMDKETLGEWLK